MMRTVKLSVLSALLLSVAANLSAVPTMISYQGLLNDSGGVPVTGSVTMVFSLYREPTGGVTLWSETQTVAVANGLFSVQLGSVQPLSAALFADDVLYLGIRVGVDQEMLPRQRLTSVAFSQRAETVTPPIVPVGGIVAWTKSLPGTPALPVGWVECNGQVLNDATSPYNGQTIPNLNGVAATPRFLRGGATSGVTGGTENHSHSVPSTRSNMGTGGGVYAWFNPAATNETSTLPSYYTVVWIMRVK